MSHVAPAGSDLRWLSAAIELSRRCPPSDSAYAVGAIVVDGAGRQVAAGYSREHDPADHAEEVALAGLPAGAVDLSRATMYTSLEPCSVRVSRARTCTELILAAGLRRVVFALREPPILADCRGAEMLASAGVEVIEMEALADVVRAINADLIGSAAGPGPIG